VLAIWEADTAPITLEGRYFSVPDVSVLRHCNARTRRCGWPRRRWTGSAPPPVAASTCCACRS
jgi:hypothetical protein